MGQDVQLFFFVLGQCVLLLELEDSVLQVVVDSVLLQIFLVGVEQRLALLLELPDTFNELLERQRARHLLACLVHGDLREGLVALFASEVLDRRLHARVLVADHSRTRLHIESLQQKVRITVTQQQHHVAKVPAQHGIGGRAEELTELGRARLRRALFLALLLKEALFRDIDQVW